MLLFLRLFVEEFSSTTLSIVFCPIAYIGPSGTCIFCQYLPP